MKNSKIILLGVMLLSLVATTYTQNVPFYVPVDSLLSWWSFTGNADDESGNGNHGIPSGAILTTDRYNNPDCAYLFSQNTHIRTSYNDTNSSNYFAYSFWVCPTDSLVLQQEGYMSNMTNIGKQCVIHPNHGISYGSYSNNAGAGVYVGTNGVVVLHHSHNYIKRALVHAANLTNWHHIVITYTDKLASLYIDGQFIKDGVADSMNVHPSLGYDNTYISYTNFTKSGIGAGFNSNYNNGHFFNGKIDDFGIWSRPLTEKEIAELYTGCTISVISQPTDQTAYINETVKFYITSSDSLTSYQWQINAGLGFQNVEDIGQFSGVDTDTLTISNLTLVNNNNLVRCILSLYNCKDTSNVVSLIVLNPEGITFNEQNNLCTIFPNPIQNKSHLKVNSKLIGSEFFIYNSIGKIVSTGKISSEITSLDFSQLASGIYLFSIKGQIRQTIKVIKE